jgi:hypothetical protein
MKPHPIETAWQRANQGGAHLRPSAERYYLLLAVCPAPRITRTSPRTETPLRCRIGQTIRQRPVEEVLPNTNTRCHTLDINSHFRYPEFMAEPDAADIRPDHRPHDSQATEFDGAQERTPTPPTSGPQTRDPSMRSRSHASSARMHTSGHSGLIVSRWATMRLKGCPDNRNSFSRRLRWSRQEAHKAARGRAWKQHRPVHSVFFVPALIVLTVTTAWGIAPRYLSDEELAQYPIIVVAQWNKADFKAHNRYEQREGMGKVRVAVEAFTELQVLRVIKGDVKPGTHKLKIGWGVSWSANGEYLSSGTSTDLPGDVNSVVEPNLWFLQRERSWDKHDDEAYLSINHYRSIQPLALEGYFGILRSRHPETAVPKLLASDDPEVVRRTLRYVCGGITPLLEQDAITDRYLEPSATGKLLKAQADAVKQVVERNGNQQARAMAVVAYWNLKGIGGLEFIRHLLRDASPSVRCAAIVLLARQRDEQSVQPIIKAAEGIHDGSESCSLIKALAEWADARLVPALIPFLRNGGDADLSIPALKAKQALYSLTGHQFPFDVESSRRAWAAVQNMTNREERTRRLDELQPEDPFPLKADVVGNGSTNATVRVTNKSRQEVVITRDPGCIDQAWPGGVAGGRAETKGRPDFVTLKPGDSISIPVTLCESSLLADPTTRKLTLAYTDNGSARGVNAWIGQVNAEFGADWREQRKIEHVEEKWPNGNLKAVGQTVNGKRIGDWEFFNENGDRTQIVGYTGGHGSADCNPDHPDNKGAGKRSK